MRKNLKIVVYIIFFVFETLIAKSASVYLIRQDIKTDSIWIEEDVKTFYFKNCGLPKDYGIWFTFNELVKKKSDILVFNFTGAGSVQLGLEVENNTKSISIKNSYNLNIHLINHHFGYLRKRKSGDETKDFILSDVKIKYINEEEIELDGSIVINSENPITHQEIVFDKHKLKLLTLENGNMLAKKDRQSFQDANIRRNELFNKAYKIKKNFYDSLFNDSKYPNAKLEAKVNLLSTKKEYNINYKLDRSYCLENAKTNFEDTEKYYEVLGGNIFKVEKGNKLVLNLHCLDDIDQDTYDDETNYSLNIELDSLVKTGQYVLDSNKNEFKANFAFVHYGPGKVIRKSKKSSGILTIVKNDQNTIKGNLDLDFNINSNMNYKIKGEFELPKISIKNLEFFYNELDKIYEELYK